MRWWKNIFEVLFAAFLCASPLHAQIADSGAVVNAERDVSSYVWQLPVYSSATVITGVAGASRLFLPFMKKQNILVREEVQLWRRTHLDNRFFYFDNVMQYVPVSSMLLLNICKVPSRHTFWQQAHRGVGAIIINTAIVFPIKEAIGAMRPDGHMSNSFPSGHTATSFLGAELLRLEYGHTSPLIPAAGYTVAAFTGLMRIYNDRHWMGDVLAGAAIGILSANLSFWLNEKVENAYHRRHPKDKIR